MGRAATPRAGRRALQGASAPWRTLVVALVAALAVGCGARTGLKVPDADSSRPNTDAGPDAGLDAGPDAGLDAGLDADIPCVEVPFDGGTVLTSIETEAELGRADVVFLIDTTASMEDEIDRIRSQLRDRLAPAINEAIPDAEFAVATFADFPVRPYGERGQDLPFILMMPRGEEVARVQAAVNSIELGDGRDEPESQVEALYQLSTGEGIGGFVAPSAGCPTGGIGYPCFRTDALPVVLLFTDAPFHNGPDGGHPYGPGVLPSPHDYDQALDELRALGAHVIGFNSGDGASRRDLERVASDTGALDGSGDPLVYDIGRTGNKLGTGVVEAIKTFAGSVVFDIDVVVSDPEPGDGVDVTDLVREVRPLSADPPDGIEGIDRDAGVFRGVRAGTKVTFELVVRNDVVASTPEPQSYRVQLIFRGDGRTRLGTRSVFIVIPGTDGGGCELVSDP